MVNRTTVLAALVGSMFLAGPATAQQTTGALRGSVVDEQGLAVPGAAVTVMSASLMGAQTAASDASGQFRIVNLPPGLYRIEVALQGFGSFVQTNIRVEVGGVTAVKVLLRLATVSEELTVSADAPVVDVERSDMSFKVNQAAISALPIAPRLGYQGMWQVLPGVTGGNVDYLGNENGDPHVNAGFRANESGQAGVRNQNDSYENNVFIDGMDVNDPMSGRSATSLNYEAIEEVNVKTGGFEAEFGSGRSAQMQVVTKSGGNTFSGSLLFQVQPDKWNWSNVEAGSSQRLSYYNPSAVLGGPILHDSLWFLASWKYDFENLTYPDTRAVEKLNRERRGNLWYGKLTSQINPGNRVAVAFGYDRIDIRNTVGDTRYSLPEALSTQERGGPLLSIQYTSTLTATTLLSVSGGYNKKPSIEVAQGSGPRLRYHDRYLGTLVRYEGNNYRNYDSNRETFYFHPNLTFYPNKEMLGRHEFKVGMEGRPNTRITRAYIYNVDNRNLYELYYGLDHTTYGLSQPYLYEAREVFPVGPYNKVRVASYAAYVQDRWRPTDSLTVSAGLRWEKARHRTLGRGDLPASLEIFDPDIRSEIEVDDSAFAPRFGATYNFGTRGGVLRGSGGRFHERVGTGDYNNYPVGQGFNTYRVPQADFGRGTEALRIFTSGTIPVNPAFNRDMKIEYNDEFTVGYERSLPWNLAVETAFIWRNIRVSESRDANVRFNADGTFSRLDPTFDRVNFRDFLTGDSRLRDVTYKSLQISVRRNFTARAGLLASFSRYWTKEDWRRFDETETYQFAYASPDAMDRSDYGPRWNGKISGFYMLPKGVALSTFINAYSGEWVNDITGDYAWNADAPRIRLPNGRQVANIIWQARNSYYVDRQYGASGRYTDNVYNVNLRVVKEFVLGSDKLELSADWFNLFNWSAYTGYESADIRRPNLYGNQINPQRPRAMQANVRFLF